MPKNYPCKFMVSTLQLEKIRQQALEKGFHKVATYLRELALNNNQLLEEKILETNRLVHQIIEVLDHDRKRRR